MFNYEIVDNVFDEELFRQIYHEEIFGVDSEEVIKPSMPFHYCKGVAYADDEDFYFVHKLFDYSQHMSDYSKTLLFPLLDKIDAYALIQAKVNMFTKTPENHLHNIHTDMEKFHKTCIFYINTCNGGTMVGENDEIFVNSVANRALIMHEPIPHRSVSCTDENVRVVINVNYIA